MGATVVKYSSEALKLEFQSRWLRLLTKLLPELREIRRYRIFPPGLEGQTGRRLLRQIAEQMQRAGTEETP